MPSEWMRCAQLHSDVHPLHQQRYRIPFCSLLLFASLANDFGIRIPQHSPVPGCTLVLQNEPWTVGASVVNHECNCRPCLEMGNSKRKFGMLHSGPHLNQSTSKYQSVIFYNHLQSIKQENNLLINNLHHKHSKMLLISYIIYLFIIYNLLTTKALIPNLVLCLAAPRYVPPSVAGASDSSVLFGRHGVRTPEASWLAVGPDRKIHSESSCKM